MGVLQSKEGAPGGGVLQLTTDASEVDDYDAAYEEYAAVDYESDEEEAGIALDDDGLGRADEWPFVAGAEAFEQSEAIEYAQIEEGLVLARRMNDIDDYVILALQGTPLVDFCIKIAQRESDALTHVNSLQMATFEEMNADTLPPGVIGQLSVEYFGETAIIRTLDEQGGPHFTEVGDGDKAGGAVMSQGMPVLDERSQHYAASVTAHRKQKNGLLSNSERKAAEDVVHQRHAATFSMQGDTGLYDKQASRGFTTTSPVDDSSNWMVVNRHYWILFCAYSKMCTQNGLVLHKLKQSLDGHQDAAQYILGPPQQSTTSRDAVYSAATERHVLRRLVEVGRQSMQLENNITTQYTRARQMLESLARTLHSLETDKMKKFDEAVKLENGKGVLPLRSHNFTDTNTAIQTAKSSVAEIDAILKELERLRSLRIADDDDNNNN